MVHDMVHYTVHHTVHTSLQARFAIEESLKALAEGKCVVIGLVSTGEAKANEAADRASMAGRDLEGEISTPHEIARDVLEKHMPTAFADGSDSPLARQLKGTLLAQLERIKMPGNALDLLVAQVGSHTALHGAFHGALHSALHGRTTASTCSLRSSA